MPFEEAQIVSTPTQQLHQMVVFREQRFVLVTTDVRDIVASLEVPILTMQPKVQEKDRNPCVCAQM